MTLIETLSALLLLFGSFLILRAVLEADDRRPTRTVPAEDDAPDYRRAA